MILPPQSRGELLITKETFICPDFSLDTVAHLPVFIQNVLAEELHKGVTVGTHVTGINQVCNGEVNKIKFSLIIFVHDFLMSLEVVLARK